MVRSCIVATLLVIGLTPALTAAEMPDQLIVVNHADDAVVGSRGPVGQVVKAARRHQRDLRWEVVGTTWDDLLGAIERPLAFVVWHAEDGIDEAKRTKVETAASTRRIPVIYVHADWNKAAPADLQFAPGAMRQTVDLAGWRKRVLDEGSRDYERGKWVDEAGALDRDGEEILVEALAWQLGIPAPASPLIEAFADTLGRSDRMVSATLIGGEWALGPVSERLPVSLVTLLPRTAENLGLTMNVSARTGTSKRDLDTGLLSFTREKEVNGRPVEAPLSHWWANRREDGCTFFFLTDDAWMAGGKRGKPRNKRRASGSLADVVDGAVLGGKLSWWVVPAPADLRLLTGASVGEAQITAYYENLAGLLDPHRNARLLVLPPSGSDQRVGVIDHWHRCLCMTVRLPYRPDPMLDFYRQNNK